ncbi:biotin--[acetyl-CoA-carboxylase] ligase [Panacibacter microcysteis]|nr:biotin--[acetyl-CoA-carboxylase] ligase [Panacibacter microcysteis]
MTASSTNNPLGTPLLEIDSTGSTNNYAMEMINNGTAAHGTAVFAHEQTAGKGQRGKSWITTKGENILLSVIIDARQIATQPKFLLSMAMAVAVHDFFGAHCVDENSVKWPNDLYWRDRKAGGILIENVLRGMDWQWSIVGIGININQTRFADVIQNPVSLKQITGKNHDPLMLAKQLCAYLDKSYNTLCVNPASIKDRYNSILYKKNTTVTLKKGNVLFDCTINSVDEHGRLKVTAAMEQSFEVGEIEWIR